MDPKNSTLTEGLPASLPDQINASLRVLAEYTFTPNDVTITINKGGRKWFGRVSSYSMSQASPVWKKFLFPPWAEPGAGPIANLDFTDDNPVALLILLQIAHLQFKDLARTQDVSTITAVAILCDQYDCVSIVLPWLPGWMQCLRIFWPSPLERSKADCRDFGKLSYRGLDLYEIAIPDDQPHNITPRYWGRALFAFWVFGAQDSFEAATEQLARILITKEGHWGFRQNYYSCPNPRCPVNNNGQPSEEFLPLLEPLPPGLLDHIVFLKYSMIKDLLEVVWNNCHLDHIRQSSADKGVHCLALLLMLLEKEGISRKSCPDELLSAFLDVYDIVDVILGALDKVRKARSDQILEENHDDCEILLPQTIEKTIHMESDRYTWMCPNPQMAGLSNTQPWHAGDRIDGALREIMNQTQLTIKGTVMETYRNHMSEQRKKLGVEEDWGFHATPKGVKIWGHKRDCCRLVRVERGGPGGN